MDYIDAQLRDIGVVYIGYYCCQNGEFRPVETIKTVDIRDHVCSSVNWASICCISGTGKCKLFRIPYVLQFIHALNKH